MCKGLRIDMVKGQIVMSNAVAKQASIFGTYEYECLQEARQAYPDYKVVRRQIKKNTTKNSYKGLTYDYMREYIMMHEPVETRLNVLEAFEDLIIRTKCHDVKFRYPYVKSCFLRRYPEVANLSMGDSARANVAEATFALNITREENVA